MTLQEIKDVNNAYIERFKNGHCLKLKDLRKLIENTYTMDENTPVVVERIEDFYFEKNGWDTYKGLSVFYYQGRQLREDLKKENWQEDYPKLTQEQRDSIVNETEADFYTDQFYAAWWATADKKDNIIKIHSHY
jgi:hypothetical protein